MFLSKLLYSVSSGTSRPARIHWRQGTKRPESKEIFQIKIPGHHDELQVVFRDGMPMWWLAQLLAPGVNGSTRLDGLLWYLPWTADWPKLSWALQKKGKPFPRLIRKLSLTPALIVLIDYVVDFAPSHLDRLPGWYRPMLQSHSAVTLFSIWTAGGSSWFPASFFFFF